MTPPLWNNIYKGALGEVVGKYLFECIIKEKLQEIEDVDLFELFDYKVQDLPIYVDFKNWHEGKTTDKKAMIEKITEKAIKCNCKCVIVANIFARSGSEYSIVENNQVRIVTIPYLVTEESGEIKLDTNNWNVIKGCIDEFKD